MNVSRQRQQKLTPVSRSRSLPFFYSRRERAYLVENLSVLVGAGMSVPQALQAIRDELRSAGMRRIVDQIREDSEQGEPLWQAMQRTKLFPQYTISLMRVGEASGNLTQNLKAIASQEQKDRAFKSKIRSALLYPVFVLTLTVIIGLGVAWFVLPRLASVFASLTLDLPTITKVFINLGVFLEQHGDVVVPLIALVLLIIVYVVFYFPPTRHIGQELLFRLPGIRKLVQEVELARLGYLLGTLLQAGLPIVDAFEALAQATISPSFARLYRHMRTQISEGQSLQNSFDSYHGSRRMVPIPFQQMIVAGEQSGNLATTLIKIGEIFEVKTESTTKNVAVILEPVLLVIVWLGVVAVALAVILPLYSLIGSFNP